MFRINFSIAAPKIYKISRNVEFCGALTRGQVVYYTYYFIFVPGTRYVIRTLYRYMRALSAASAIVDDVVDGHG